MKVCTKCKKNKDETCFHKRSKSKDGFYASAKNVCQSIIRNGRSSVKRSGRKKPFQTE